MKKIDLLRINLLLVFTTLLIFTSDALAKNVGIPFMKSGTTVGKTSSELSDFSIPSSTLVDEIKIADNLTETTEYTLDYHSPIWSAVFKGTLSLENEASYVRVILRDDNDTEYLIFDSFYLTEEEGDYEFANLCEETCRLDSILPEALVVEVYQASVYVDAIKVSSGDPHIILSEPDTKDNQVQFKIDVLAERVKRKNQDWIPGDTSISRMSYEEKKEFFGGTVPQLYGFDTYKGGVFSFPVPGNSKFSGNNRGSSNEIITNSVLMNVRNFNWRCAHQYNDCMHFMTTVEDQGSCNSCWAFAAIGALEALPNVYYNREIDFDFSEQDLVSCSGAGSCSGGGDVSVALNYVQNLGTYYESCFPYAGQDLSCSLNTCYPNMNLVKMEDKKLIPNDYEEIMHAILQYGPLTACMNYGEVSSPYNGGTISNHCMTLIGYDDDSWDVYDELEFKNSWGENWGVLGYCRIYYSTIQNLHYVYALINPLRGNDHFSYVNSIGCYDNDGDGYCWWGIGPKPVSCENSNCLPGRDWNDRYSSAIAYQLFYPILENPLSRNTVTNPNITFKWYPAKNVQYYILNVRSERTITNSSRDNYGYLLARTSATQYVFDLGGMAPNGGWIYWDVTAVNSNGKEYVSQRGEFKLQ